VQRLDAAAHALDLAAVAHGGDVAPDGRLRCAEQLAQLGHADHRALLGDLQDQSVTLPFKHLQFPTRFAQARVTSAQRQL
jgi:hypothetical protein